jgi:hypothetical protein
MDPNRRDLLEDLFSGPSSVPPDELLTAIHREKLRRARGQRALALGTSFAVLVAVTIFHSWLSAPTPVPKQMQMTSVPGGTPAVPGPEPFQVARLDDEGLLKLLDNTPAAMVRWPNGQRALMLLGQTSLPD